MSLVYWDAMVPGKILCCAFLVHLIQQEGSCRVMTVRESCEVAVFR